MTLIPFESTLSDIIESIVDIVKSRVPSANVEAGYPLYDLVIAPFADIIFSERNSVDILRQVSAVLPLFDDEGYLKYPEYEEQLRSRFFMFEEGQDSVPSEIDLRFKRPYSFSISVSSYIILGTTSVLVYPIIVSADDPDWKESGGYFLYSVPIQEIIGLFSISSSWDTSAINIAIEGDGELLGAVSSSAQLGVNGSPATLTLDNIQKSISNRSYSNERAIKYHLGYDIYFSPDSLHKFMVFGSNDTIFVEAYERIYKTSPTTGESIPVQVRSGGKGKLMLDYGYDYEQSIGVFEAVSAVEPCPFDLSAHPHRLLYRIKVYQSTGLLHPLMFYSSANDNVNYTEQISSDIRNLVSNPEAINRTQIYDSVEKRSYSNNDQEFHIADPTQVYGSGYYLEGNATSDLYIASFTLYKGSANVPVDQAAVYIPNLEFDSDNKSIEITIFSDPGSSGTYIPVAMGNLRVASAAMLAGKTVELIPLPGHSVKGQIVLSSLITGSSPDSSERTTLLNPYGDIRIVRGSTVLGVANDCIYVELALKATHGSNLRKSIDDHLVYFGYVGTDQTKLAVAEAGLRDRSRRELPITMMVAPYRAVVLYMELSSEYLSPLPAVLTPANTADYKVLVTKFNEYLSSYTGGLTDLDISEISEKFRDVTHGISIVKLDFYVYTQSGLTIMSDYLSVYESDKHKLDFASLNTYLNRLGLPSTVTVEEGKVTVPEIYKFILSPIVRES